MSSRRQLTRRDQSPSSFAPALGRLCESAGVVAVALVDRDGEAVDYAGSVKPFDIRVAAAEWRLILSRVERSEVAAWCGARVIVARGEQKSFAVARLGEGYALVLQLVPRCFRFSARALAEAIHEISEDAGLPVDARLERWVRVQVTEARFPSRRPRKLWLANGWSPVEVIGRFVEPKLGRGEIGYRVRLTRGGEVTLVREPLGHWFADYSDSPNPLQLRA